MLRTLIAVVGLAATANASALLIDFTDARWMGVNGRTSFSQNYDGLEVTVSSTRGNLTFNSPGPSAPALLQRDGDGLGIQDDEVSYTNREILSVAFNQNVTVLGYYLLDLFANEGPNREPEAARATFVRSVGGNTVFTDLGTATDNVGFYARTGLSVTGFDRIRFMALNGSYSDFAVAGIEIAATAVTPIPPALALFLSGLGVLGWMGRRRRASTAPA